MGGGCPESRAAHSWRTLLALLCILLVVIAGTVQLAHTHADGADTHANCSLCVAAHVIVHMVQTPAPVPAASVVAVLESQPPSAVASASSTFALFNRPPPVVAAAA